MPSLAGRPQKRLRRRSAFDEEIRGERAWHSPSFTGENRLQGGKLPAAVWLDFHLLRRETKEVAFLVAAKPSFPMPTPLAAPDILNREFLEIRCKILEL